MPRKKQEQVLSCSNCKVGSCQKRDKAFPDFCLTTNTDAAVIQEAMDKYRKDEELNKIALTAAEIEGEYYGKATRVEEILLFIKKMGYKKIGIATCIGLMNECQLFAKVAKAKGIEVYSVACKVGSIDKTEFGIPEETKVHPNEYEAMCNPILQAEVLNRAETDFNIIIGLCVGHDTLFIKHSKAPITYLIVKDRILCHNPAAALYTSNSYYQRLLNADE